MRSVISACLRIEIGICVFSLEEPGTSEMLVPISLHRIRQEKIQGLSVPTLTGCC